MGQLMRSALLLPLYRGSNVGLKVLGEHPGLLQKQEHIALFC